MRVKLQLVMCNDEGDEETVTDVITLNKNNQRIEHLGLTLSEAKQLLSTTQRHLVWSKYTNMPSHRRSRFYQHPHFDLSSVPLSPILSVKRDGKA
jgi:hypothetical protein